MPKPVVFRKMGVQRHEALAEDEPAENACASSVLNQGALPSESANSNPCVNTESSAVNESDGIFFKKSNTSHIYRQDVVKNITSGMIGIVTEVAGDSDSDSDSSITDDENDSEDEDGDGEEGDDSNNASRNSESNVSAGHCKTDALLADQLRVLWMDESESTQNFNDVEVVDRGFLHGDFVAAASDPTGQVGVVVDVNICVDLLSHDGSMIKDVSSKNIQRIRDFTVGDYVVLGPWLGRVDDVLDNVTVLFDDGSVCKVSKADPLNLKPISKNIVEDGHFPYYPGQRVRASSSSVFKNSRWLSGLWKANRLEGTVTKVTVGSVFVYWIASAGYGPYSSTAPAEEQSPKNLKLLSCFAHANWQLGDWCLLPSSVLSSSVSMDKGMSKLELNDSANNELDSNQTGSGCDSEEATVEETNGNKDTMELDPADTLQGNDGHEKSNPSRDSSSCCSSISVSKEPVHEAWPLHRKKIRKVVIRKEKRARKKEESFEKALLIANTRTKVDVAWQDGTIGHELNSTSLIPIDNPGDHEFVSEQYVVEKTSDDGDDISEARRVGVVRSVNAKERTACVRWLRKVARAEDPREFDNEEVVSVYELEGHPDYDYCYGDVVVRLTPVSAHLETASVEESTEKSEQKTEDCGIKKEANIQTDANRVENASSDTSMQFSDLSWVGNITGLKNGDIEVTWADGMVSTVGPQAIYVVGRDDDDESIAAGSEVSDAASWETVNDDEMEVLEDSREDIQRENSSSVTSEAEESGENDFGRAAALSVPLAAFRFVTRLASGIFSRGPRNLDSIDMQIKAGHEHPSPVVNDESSSQRLIPINGDTSGSKNGRYEEVVSEATETVEACDTLYGLKKEDALANCDNGSCSLKHFDITQDPSDHYFIGANGQSNNRKWLKKVQQDWNILQNNLPEEIYVRVYEDRMDLLRAVIVGPYGTPYQDGLFFFDFHLPPEYPDVPPSAYYHSGGWRINPNLYEEGKVCLSLLNTWTGRGNEVWDPKSSSILQVLVSLQGLVLNSKPYFNEAGYDKQIGTAEGEKNSLSYNENTFLLNCKTMMYLMRKPPKESFEKKMIISMESSVVENIVIVGAGIAGLATSLALHRLGVRSLVLEYSDSLRVTGFALTTWTNAWKALDALGVGDILRHQHLQLQQNVTTSLSMGQQTSSLCLMGTGKHGDGEVRCVRRQLMIEALAKELPSGTIRFSSKVVAIQESGLFKILHLADGTTIKTKVLIGCDGINSVVAKWLGFKEASFTGRYVIRGDIKLMNNHGLQPNFMHFFGKGFRSGVLPCDETTVYWFFTWTPTTEEKELVKNPGKMKRLVLEKCEKMPSHMRCFIEKTEAEDILTSPLRYRKVWELVSGNISKGNVCVVGDAYHPMAPDLGQGGCCSLEDGIVLGRCLAQAFCKKGETEEQYKEIEACLRKYEKERRWRNIDISVTSYVLGLLLQGDFKFLAHVRDKVLPHFLAGLLLNKSDFDCGKLNTSD